MPIGEGDPVRSHLVALWRAERTSIPHRVRGVEKVADIVPPVPGDEMQQCDSPPANLEESLLKKGLLAALFAFVRSKVMQLCVQCEGHL